MSRDLSIPWWRLCLFHNDEIEPVAALAGNRTADQDFIPI